MLLRFRFHTLLLLLSRRSPRYAADFDVMPLPHNGFTSRHGHERCDVGPEHGILLERRRYAAATIYSYCLPIR